MEGFFPKAAVEKLTCEVKQVETEFRATNVQVDMSELTTLKQECEEQLAENIQLKNTIERSQRQLEKAKVAYPFLYLYF